MKYTNKALEERRKRDENEKYVKNIDSETWKIIGDAMSRKFDVEDTYTKRMVDAGKKSTQMLIALFVSPLLVGAAMRSQEVDSHRYKLKESTGEKPQYTTRVPINRWMK